MLSAAQRTRLVDAARRAVVAEVTGEVCDQSLEQVGEQPLEDDLPNTSGVFVTLKVNGELRGCLGTLDCENGLAHEVVRCAADAASQDPRFAPIDREELSELSIEVSVLTPREQIDPLDIDAVAVGRHGLVVELGRQRGLLLPQVATERDWSREQFLCQTCLKAGLPRDAWRHGATVYRFEAEVFGEL